MIRIKLLKLIQARILLASTILWITQSTNAEPVTTAAIVVQGVNLATKLLQKPSPDLTLAVVQRNRELLKGMNSKLDTLGREIIELHRMVGNIPDQLANELRQERIYVYGSNANAIGQSLLDYVEEYQLDLNSLVDSEVITELQKSYYIERLEFLEREATILSKKIMQEVSMINSDAMTLAIVAHSHLSVLTELTTRFNLRKNLLTTTAANYKEIFDRILDKNEKGSLGFWLDHRLQEASDSSALKSTFNKDIMPPLSLTHWDFDFYLNKSYQYCIKHESVHKTFNHIPGAPGEPESTDLSSTVIKTDFFVRSLNVIRNNDGILTSMISTTPTLNRCPTNMQLVEHSSVVRYTKIFAIRNVEVKEYSPEDCLTKCNRSKDITESRLHFDKINALEPLVRIWKLIEQSRDNAALVAKNDYSAYQVSDTLKSLAIYQTTIRDQLREKKRIQRETLLQAKEDERQEFARQISDMIDQQDSELNDMYVEAARNAKFNKTLSYIRLTVQIAKHWKSLQGLLSAGEKVANAEVIETTIQGLKESASREPATATTIAYSIQLLGNINKLVNLYDGLDTARQSQAKFDLALEKASDSIPAGAHQSYDVYVDKSDPFIFRFITLPDEPFISSPDIVKGGTITVVGQKTYLFTESIQLHLEVVN